MRKFFVLFSVLMIAGMLLVACKPAATTTTTTTEETTTEETTTETTTTAGNSNLDVTALKIIYVGVDTVSPYQMVNQQGIADEAQKLGITDVEYMNPTSNSDLDSQLALMDAAILEQPDIILLVPVDSAGIGTAVQKAQDAGIVVVTIGIESISIKANAHVATDSVATSYQAGLAMCEAVNDEGNILVVLGNPIHNPTQLREEGFRQAVMDNCPNVTIASEQTANWSPEVAQTVVINTLTAIPDLKGVYCENDTMGQGALAALEQLDRPDIKLVTFDCMQVMVEAVRDGKSYADACQMPFYEGQKAVDTGISILKGEDVPYFVDAGTFVVKQDNAAQFLIDYAGMLP
jgi:ribose transport system substrate-binding protein